jgi:hypothetical protein
MPAPLPDPEDVDYGDPTVSPFDECRKLLLDIEGALGSQLFTRKQQCDVMQPVIKQMYEMRKRANTLQAEREMAGDLERLRGEVYSLCAVLGLESDRYVVPLGRMVFRDALGHLNVALDELGRLEVRRRSQATDLVSAINIIRRELGEPLQTLNVVRLPTHSNKGRTPPQQRVSAPVKNGDDLSADAIAILEKKHAEAKALRNARLRLVRQLSMDVMNLWREDSQVPRLSDPHLTEIDRKILQYAKVAYSNGALYMGLASAVLDALVQRKQELVVYKQDRIRTTLEISKRLRLIEDRGALINLMHRVEAQANNPLRLFGDSRRLQLEDRFRRIAYPRLLLIEATLRPALLLYRERHRRPFLYKTHDYLALMDEELRARVIPRDMFPGDSSLMKVSLAQAEEMFGVTGDDGDIYKGVSEAMADAMRARQPDFATVLHVSTTVSDVMAERIIAKSAEDMEWMNGELLTALQMTVKSDELRLLELGWQLPTVEKAAEVRQTAIANVAHIVKPGAPPKVLRQEFFQRANVADTAKGGALKTRRLTIVSSPKRDGDDADDDDDDDDNSSDDDAAGGDAAPPSSAKKKPGFLAQYLVPTAARRDRALMEKQKALAANHSFGGGVSGAFESPDEGDSRRSSHFVSRDQLVAQPPELDIEREQCDDCRHTAAGPCAAHAAPPRSETVPRLPTAVFNEGGGYTVLADAQLVPRTIPTGDVQHLRISQPQLDALRRTRHVPFDQLQSSRDELERVRLLYRRPEKPKPDYGVPSPRKQPSPRKPTSPRRRPAAGKGAAGGKGNKGGDSEHQPGSRRTTSRRVRRKAQKADDDADGGDAAAPVIVVEGDARASIITGEQ